MVTQRLNLTQIGERLGLVDTSLIALLAERQKLVLMVEEYKRVTRQPIYRPEVELDRIQKVRTLAVKYGLNPDFVHSLFYQVIGEANKVQMIQLQKSAGLYPEAETEDAWRARLKGNLLALTQKCASSYDERYGQAFFGTRLHAEFEAAQIKQLAENTEDELALDLGCATGRHSLLLTPHFKKVAGYDISPDMVRVAQQKVTVGGTANATFIAHDLEEGIPERDESASFVVMSVGAASDIPNLPSLLREIRRVLRSGGKAFLSFYNSNALLYQWGFIPWTVGLAGEINVERHCLDIIWEEDGSERTYSVYAQAYGPNDLEALLPPGLPAVSVMTHPIVASIMPNVLFQKENVRDSVAQIDDRLAQEGEEGGAYLTVVVRKT